MKIFLSYSRKDAPFVRDLSADLEARGIDVWLDTDDLWLTATTTAGDGLWCRASVNRWRSSSCCRRILSTRGRSSARSPSPPRWHAGSSRSSIAWCELQDGFLFELAGVQRVDFVEQPYDDASCPVDVPDRHCCTSQGPRTTDRRGCRCGRVER